MEGLLLGRGFHESPPQTEVSYKLPSLQEFDQGVQALVDANSPPSNPFPQSSPSFNDVFKLHSFQTYQVPEERLPAASSPYVSSPADHHAGYAPSSSSSSLYHAPHSPYTTLLTGYSTLKLSPGELYPHAQAKQQGKHYTKLYTVEEGDFIIYCRHERDLLWEKVQSEFARLFGVDPPRSQFSLQTYYYKLNANVPCWDSQGYLIFEDNTVKPKTRKIKSSDLDRQRKDAEPLGLAQRYPERGKDYSWVEDKDKIAMSEWASKRIQQLEERREQASGSEAWDDSDDRRFQVVMGELTNRGTGVYHCPKLGRCDKGGVDKDGNLVPFEHNSSFVQHCNKHLKPFKCEEEHCPNLPGRRGFARRDQLERHWRDVRHMPSEALCTIPSRRR